MIDADDRVYCWHCRQREPRQVPVWNGGASWGPDGYVRRFVCKFNLAYNPFVLRRCARFLAVPPGRIEPFPPEYRDD